MPAGSFFLQALVPDAGLLAERLEVEIVETGEPELLLDVDSLLQRGGRLEESVKEAKAGELEGAAVVAAQHPHYELEADGFSEPEPQH